MWYEWLAFPPVWCSVAAVAILLTSEHCGCGTRKWKFANCPSCKPWAWLRR